VKSRTLQTRFELADPRARGYSFGVLKLCRVALALSMLAVSTACTKVAMPPQVTMSEVEPSGRAAKPPDCNLPVLRIAPLAEYREVAIIEGLGNRFVEEKDVLPLVVAKGCETGADALIINESRAQTSENMTGYYINAIAIIYGKRHPTVEQRTR
jgi:hypothetical protein